MKVYRVGNTTFAHDLSGEGSRLHGGRWNQIGASCVYTSQSRSLAVLEFSANVSTDRILRYLSMVEIDIPDNIFRVNMTDLPGNWREAPAPASTKSYGTNLLAKKSHAVIQIPSCIIPEEYNYLINPLYPFVDCCRIMEVKDFVYDIRVKAG